MPYPHKHAARLKPPGKYVRFRTGKDKFAKGIDAIWGITKDEKVELASIHFDAANFTVRQAKAWLADHDYKPLLFEPASKKAEGSAVRFDVGLLRWDIAAGAGGSIEKVHIEGVAYAGGKLRLPGWEHPVVVDLEGLAIPESVPLLTDHENRIKARIGMIEPRIENHSLAFNGDIFISDDEEDVARAIVEQARAGAAWQLSIGTDVEEQEVVLFTTRVNGQDHEGPFIHVKKSTLKEVSVVAVGADSSTQMRLAAQFHLRGGGEMTFEQWLEKHGISAEGLDEAKLATLKAAFEAKEDPPEEFTKKDEGAAAAGTAATVGTPATVAAKAATGIVGAQPSPVTAAGVQEIIAEERARVAAIHKLCAGEFPEVEQKAIEAGWSADQTAPAVLAATREARPTMGAPYVKSSSLVTPMDTSVLQAACALSGGIEAPEKEFEDKVLEAAHKRFPRGIGLQQLILEAAYANGYTGRSFRVTPEILRHAWGAQLQAAGFSNIDIGGILSNIANKFLLQGFFSVESTWRRICGVRPVSDFKTVTSYRMTGKNQYELVAPGGELKHGTLGEETFTNKADTYGLLLTIDRRDIINDDLGAITTIPRWLGRGSGLKINDIFWTIWLANAAGTFFVAGNNNYIEGAATTLTITGLTTGETTFMNQVDADGKPTGVDPVIVLVPPAISAVAAQLFKSLELRDTTSSTKYPTANPHAGKFRVEVSRYLSNSSYTGYSTTAWYLLANPVDLAAVEVAFLNGQESPTIETTEADFNVLGIRMRGFHDFGVALQDPKAGLMSAGA